MCRNLTTKLDEELKFKIASLKDKRKDLFLDYEECKSVLERINERMISMTNVEIVKSAGGIKEQLD